MEAARFVDLSETTDPEWLSYSPVIAETLARSMMQSQGLPVVLLRRQLPYVLLGPKDRRLPRLEEGLWYLSGRGYPAFMRISGGSAVILDRDCLSFAVARPCRDLTQWENNFREMAQAIVDGLGRLGIPAEFGAAAGSYCEGPFDIVTRGRKVAGVAQAIRQGFALVNGMVLVRQDPVAVTACLQEFYRLSGDDRTLRAEAVTSLTQELRQPDLRWAQVRDALVDGFAARWNLYRTPPTPEEAALARSLLPLRAMAAPLAGRGANA